MKTWKTHRDKLIRRSLLKRLQQNFERRKKKNREEVTDKAQQRELQEDGRQGLWAATWDSAKGHQGWDEDGVENKRMG